MVGEADGALDAVERDRERAAVGLDEQRGHDRQRQRQADLRRSCPAPSSEVSMTSPPSSRIAARTASMPTPRPEMSLVDLGGREAGRRRAARRRARRRSSRPRRRRSARARRPCGRRCAGRCRGRRRATEMTTLPPAWRAEISSVPVGAACRPRRAPPAPSRPWSSELRTRCTSGSPSASTTVRSSSVSLPTSSQLDLLAELGREVAHEPREAQEDGLDRDHPDLHDHRLQGVRACA